MKLSNKLLSLKETVGLIENGNVLAIAGEEKILKSLPKGNWIGGTIPYFMSEDGGCKNKEKIFVTDLSPIVQNVKIGAFGTDSIKEFPKNNFSNGLNYMLIPAFSDVHLYYAKETQNIEGLFNAPVFGWISGVDLDMLGKDMPMVIDGSSLTAYTDRAVVLFMELKAGQTAEMNIINIFEQDEESDSMVFQKTDFEVETCLINGTETNFYDYIKANSIDTKLPIVANYSGASINISIQALDDESKKVKLYAPVQEGATYHFAKSIDNYMTEFTDTLLGQNNNSVALSCNCILNYLYSDLDGKMIEDFKGPFTFGEIAYILVNQTLVYVNVD